MTRNYEAFVESLAIPFREKLENLAYEDKVSVEEWLSAFEPATDGELVLYVSTVDSQRHIYQGTNKIDFGRRITCPRPGCQAVRG